MTRTFVDSGVLIAAARGKGPVSAKAMGILDDPEREFSSSNLVRKEVLPKAIFHQKHDEAAFYEEFFASVAAWAQIQEEFLREAYYEACESGLDALDAIHVTAARSAGAAELVTTERPTTRIHRTTSVRAVSIHPG